MTPEHRSYLNANTRTAIYRPTQPAFWITLAVMFSVMILLLFQFAPRQRRRRLVVIAGDLKFITHLRRQLASSTGAKDVTLPRQSMQPRLIQHLSLNIVDCVDDGVLLRRF